MKHLTKEQFGRNLYRRMLEKGWNQSELARAADIPRDSVSKYVRGVSIPSAQNLQALADALGTTPEELLPNALKSTIEDDNPAFEIRGSAGAPDVVWLRVNQFVSMQKALKIGALLNEREESS